MSTPSISRSGTPDRATRIVALVQVALFVLGVGVMCLRVLPHAWRTMNTDFPNDYVAARLVREGYTVDRIYEWEWFEEQRQRMAIDQPTAGFIPHTPFSVVPLLPFTWLAPLPAKHAWIIFSLLLLAGSIACIASLSKVPWMWISTAALLYLPLYRNLEYGQYYVLLLAVLSAALWCDQKNHRFSAGVLVSVAAGLKLFPAVLVLFYLRKRETRALAGFVAGTFLVVLASLAAFGTTACLRFVHEILPAAVHGEVMDPFALPANSIPALLHNLFVFDAQRNPHPLANMPLLAGILGPLLQMLVLAPIVLVCSRQRDNRRDAVEWSALLTAALAVSTLPASYNFIVLLLPCAVLFGFLRSEGHFKTAFLCAALYLLAGWVISPLPHASGVMAIAAVPRLWILVLLAGMFFLALPRGNLLRLREEWLWAGGLAVLVVFQMISLARHEAHVYDSHAFVATSGPEIIVVAAPQPVSDGIVFHGMTVEGWRWAKLDDSDHVAFTSLADRSTWLVETKGRHALWRRTPEATQATQISSGDLDVYDFSAVPGLPLVFSAMNRDRSLELYQAEEHMPPKTLDIANARFPALSPNQRWLAYSSLQHGTWHLTIRDLQRGVDQRIGMADCNDAYPAWSSDSQTITYASDCGRGLWQTAFATVRGPR